MRYKLEKDGRLCLFKIGVEWYIGKVGKVLSRTRVDVNDFGQVYIERGVDPIASKFTLNYMVAGVGVNVGPVEARSVGPSFTIRVTSENLGDSVYKALVERYALFLAARTYDSVGSIAIAKPEVTQRADQSLLVSV